MSREPLQQRYMDEIDAAGVANRWIEELVEKHGLQKTPGVEITSKDGVVALWKGGRPIALAILLRDTFNWTILTRMDLTDIV